MPQHLSFVGIADVDVIFELPKYLIIGVCRVLLVNDVTRLEVLVDIPRVKVRVVHFLNDRESYLEVLLIP